MRDHVHACPRCYQDEICSLSCDFEPDLQEERRFSRGDRALCTRCEKETGDPWPPARRERAGKAAFASWMMALWPWKEMAVDPDEAWRTLSEADREIWRAAAQAAIAADEDAG